jgi:hypothetical protein
MHWSDRTISTNHRFRLPVTDWCRCPGRSADTAARTQLMVRYDVGVAVKETHELKSVDDEFVDDSE